MSKLLSVRGLDFVSFISKIQSDGWTVKRKIMEGNTAQAVPAFLLDESEISWFTKVNGELVYLTSHREIVTDQAKIDKFLAWQRDCEERLSKMRNITPDEYCAIKHISSE